MALEVVEEGKHFCFKTNCAYSVTCLCKKGQKYFVKRRRTKKLSVLLYSETLLICFYYLLQNIMFNDYITADAKLFPNLKSSKNVPHYLTGDILTSSRNYEGFENTNRFGPNVIFYKGKSINCKL